MFRRSKTLVISEPDPTYKVRYLGNVLTAVVKGEGCVDRPILTLWNNYNSTSSGGTQAGLDMELTVCNSGLKVITREQGLTEYRAHRITYNICSEQYPRLFVWVYRHEGKRLKAEVRCHAVLCKSELVAQTITSQLQDRLTVALDEFLREKRRSQNSRLSIRLHRPLSLPNDISNPAGSVRTKFLKVGQNFRPPIGHSNSAPKLGSITEGDEDELAAASATDELMRNSETSAWQSRLDHECDNDGDTVFSSSPHTRGANGHLHGTGADNEDDVTSSLSNDVSSLRITCHDGSDVSACVEMLPAGGGVDSDDENDYEDEKPSQRFS